PGERLQIGLSATREGPDWSTERSFSSARRCRLWCDQHVRRPVQYANIHAAGTEWSAIQPLSYDGTMQPDARRNHYWPEPSFGSHSLHHGGCHWLSRLRLGHPPAALAIEPGFCDSSHLDPPKLKNTFGRPGRVCMELHGFNRAAPFRILDRILDRGVGGP